MRALRRRTLTAFSLSSWRRVLPDLLRHVPLRDRIRRHLFVPKSSIPAPTAPLGQALLSIASARHIAVQHSVMARQGFKKV